MKHTSSAALAVAFACGLAWWGCSNEDSPTVHDEWVGHYYQDQSYKSASDYKPFKGKNEQEYLEATGSTEDRKKLLKLISLRLATLMREDDLRGDLLSKLNSMTRRKANLSAVAIEYSNIGDHLSRDFKSVMASNGIGGQLATQTVAGDTDADAFLKVSQSLFDLQVQVVAPKTGTWDTAGEMPVYFNPLSDESETTQVEGYNPDGVAIATNPETGAAGPVLYVSYDEEFFNKPDNQPNTPDPEMAWAAPSFENSPNRFDTVLRLFGVSPAFADRPDGHYECYDDWLLQGLELYWENDHETWPDDNPEMFTRVRLMYKYEGYQDSYGSWTWKRKNLYEEDDREEWNVLPTGTKFYWHSYKTCDEFSWDYDSYGDHGDYQVWENDIGDNTDDKVGRWDDVPTNNGWLELCDTSGCSWIYSGWPTHARLRVNLRAR